MSIIYTDYGVITISQCTDIHTRAAGVDKCVNINSFCGVVLQHGTRELICFIVRYVGGLYIGGRLGEFSEHLL